MADTAAAAVAGVPAPGSAPRASPVVPSPSDILRPALPLSPQAVRESSLASFANQRRVHATQQALLSLATPVPNINLNGLFWSPSLVGSFPHLPLAPNPTAVPAPPPAPSLPLAAPAAPSAVR